MKCIPVRLVSVFVLCSNTAAKLWGQITPEHSQHGGSTTAFTIEPRVASAESQSEGSPLLLDTVLRQTLQNNPSLKVARANWEAMKLRVPQARAWEDLRASFDGVAGRFVNLPPNAMTDQRLMLEQTIPIAGKNRLHGEAAEAEAIAAYQEVKRRELDLKAKVRTAFYRLANAYEQLRIIDSNLELLQQLVRTSRSKYEAGTKPQSDILMAETDASKLEETRYDVIRQISDKQSELNVLMNRPAQSALDKPSDPAFPAVPLEVDQIQSVALRNRPEVISAARRVEAAKARFEAKRREWIPEPSIRVQASRYNDANQPISEVMAGVSVNLPWLNRGKYKAAIEEAAQMKAAAEYELEAARNETRGMVRDALTRAQTYHHHVELFRDRILPLARQNASAARLAYETDKTSFLSLIEAQRTLQESEGMYWSHLTEYLSALAELESVIGTEPQVTLNPEHRHE